jgi:hypothetical protein
LSERSETKRCGVPVAVGAVCAWFGRRELHPECGLVSRRRGLEKVVEKFL